MPQRSNAFQRFIYLLYQKLDTQAKVTESAFLQDVRTGQSREVDILIETVVAESVIRIGIECRSGGRPATVEWVERMIGKHADLPTNELILISESGFAATALDKARASMVKAIAIEDAVEADWTEIVNKVKTVYLGSCRFTLRQFSITFEPPVVLPTDAVLPLDTPVLRGDQLPAGTIQTNVDGAFAGVRGSIMQQAPPGKMTKAEVTADPKEEVFIRRTEGLHRIRRITMQIECIAKPRIPVDLIAASFRDSQVAYGQVQTPEVDGVVGVLERRKDEKDSEVTWLLDVKELNKN